MSFFDVVQEAVQPRRAISDATDEIGAFHLDKTSDKVSAIDWNQSCINIPFHVDINCTYEDIDLIELGPEKDSSAGNAQNNCSQNKEVYRFTKDSYDECNVVYDDENPVSYIEDEVSYMIPMPKLKKPKDTCLAPLSVMVVDTIGTRPSKLLLKVLLDPGSTKTLISRRCIPKESVLMPLSERKSITTLAGTMTVGEMIPLRKIRLPEFDKNRIIDEQKALIFDSDCRHDVILGADFLTKTGINILYQSGTMEWFENIIAMRDPRSMNNKEYLAMADAVEVQREEEELDLDWLECHLAAPILEAKYEKLDIPEFTNTLTHLTPSQRNEIRDLLLKHSKLFDGTLGVYPHAKFHIELEEGAKPVHSRPYAVPKVHMQTFKRELDHLIEIGVLSRQGPSEWASPSFIIPKKDGRVRWISDLRALNKVIKRKQYPLPIIKDILSKRPGYEFFTKLDISMQYYTFELDDESKDLCTIITPYGKFKYNRLPMGLKCSPDIAQNVMENVLREIEDIDVYIDDVGCFSQSWESHLALLDEVLGRLRTNGFTVNPLKCEWGVKETDWLGYWLTPTGLKPWKKKIDAVLKMEPPKKLKELRGFIGAVNYYRDMWPQRSHILAPLTQQVGATKFVWTVEMQNAFDKMKAIMAMDALSAYPDHNKEFHIYTDASDYQLGACIMQEGRPVAYYSRKLNSAQRNYTVQEKELLSVVMTLKEFRTMLLGAKLHVYTDHVNNTCETLRSQRVLRWRSFLEEYSPELHYVKGEDNVIADTFSRLGISPGEGYPLKGKNDRPNPGRASPVTVGDEDAYLIDPEWYSSSIVDDYELGECLLNLSDDECYLNLPYEDIEENPLNLQRIRDKQRNDDSIAKWRQKNPDHFKEVQLGSVEDLIVYIKDIAEPNNWRIVLPDSMLDETVKWFHIVTGHPGAKRLHLTLSAKYYNPRLRSKVDKYTRNCPDCQRHKLDGKGYGLLPEREVRSVPFEEVAVDLIGPWTLQIRGKPYTFSALTVIDTVTALVELIRIDSKDSHHIATKFAQSWLARYPWPERCVHDNGGEFTGYEFQRLLEKTHIKDAPTTARNPQANAICERMHQTVGNILRTLLHENPPKDVGSGKKLIEEALSIAMHALRSSVHTTLGGSPGSLVFNRDMFLNIPLVADWHQITKRREQIVNANLLRENKRRRRFDYAVNQRALIKLHAPTKMGERTVGPFNITQVHTNGTITVERRPGVTERINIRRVIPFRET